VGVDKVKEIFVVRIIFALLLGAIAFFLKPFDFDAPMAGLAGLTFGLVCIFVETQLRRVTLQRIIGAVAGAILGIFAAFLISLVLRHIESVNSHTISFLEVGILALAAYLGLVIGAAKGDMLNLAALGGLIGGERSPKQALNILDTSVIIDGRIADIAETGFLDGTLAIPQFVLRELQLVADSADSVKRNRGRRGLDILQRLQKMPQLEVRIMEEDFPNIREVDMKLVEIGKLFNCKVVTNDFNLNKVAQLHGVEILNINELANALKPIVLPGETMRVFILKEGKEYNQGVAYLDDGTMVVVDNARKLISKTIDISVTSVLQTTAGKMIFGKFDERAHHVHDNKAVERSPRQETPSAAAAQQG
jgi:uncharacterized protein YacL